MKQFLTAAALTFVALAGSISLAADAPQPPKPVLVASFSGYNAWRSDLKYLGELADAPELATLLEQQLNTSPRAAGLAGLDKSRPWGAALRTEGLHSVQLIGFLPVTDLKSLLVLFTGGTEEKPEDNGNGVWRINVRFAPFFIKEHKGWAYVTGSPEVLTQLPDDPLAWLAGLDKEYDLAFRLFPQHVRADARPQILEALRALLFLSRMSQGDSGASASRDTLTRLLGRQLDATFAWLEEIESLTLGWNLDAPRKQAYLDFNMTPVAGSKLAARKQVPAEPTNFAGLTALGATVLNFHLHSQLEAEEVETWAAGLASLQTHIAAEIDAAKDQSPAEKTQVKAAVAELIDVLQATVKQGVINGAVTIEGVGPITIVGGLRLEKPAHLETLVKKLATEAKSRLPKLGVTLDAQVRDGLRFHGLTIPVSELDANDDERNELLGSLFGEALDVTLAFGEKELYWALGPQGMPSIQAARAKNAAGPADTPKSPLQATVNMQRYLHFLSRQDGADAMLAFYANRLERSGLDKLRWTIEPAKPGFHARLHLEEGVVRLLGIQLNVKATP